MIGSDQSPPSNLNDLFSFYHGFVKELYADASTSNTLPIETLFELNAALDHLSRRWVYQEHTSEKDAVGKAYSHLKRACLDLFKLRVKEAKRQYDELCRIDTSAIDNGDFDRGLREKYNEIRRLARDARKKEGTPDTDDKVASFEPWKDVYIKCVDLDGMYHHPKLKWAKRRGIIAFFRQQWIAFIMGIITGLLVCWIWDLAHPVYPTPVSNPSVSTSSTPPPAK